MLVTAHVAKMSIQYIFTDVELSNDKAVLSQTVYQCASLAMYIKIKR